MYMVKRGDPSIEPLGTPHVTVWVSDFPQANMLSFSLLQNENQQEEMVREDIMTNSVKSS